MNTYSVLVDTDHSHEQNRTSFFPHRAFILEEENRQNKQIYDKLYGDDYFEDLKKCELGQRMAALDSQGRHLW